jgi:hypothetical protein
MRLITFSLLFVICCLAPLTTQHLLTGFVLDANSGDPLPYVRLYDIDTDTFSRQVEAQLTIRDTKWPIPSYPQNQWYKRFAKVIAIRAQSDNALSERVTANAYPT